jgi:hypothetical protein
VHHNWSEFSKIFQYILGTLLGTMFGFDLHFVEEGARRMEAVWGKLKTGVNTLKPTLNWVVRRSEDGKGNISDGSRYYVAQEVVSRIR